MIDQWPYPNYFKFKRNQKLPSNFKVDQIEKFFAKKYNAKYAILAPSGRAGINIILRYLRYDRSKIVNIPMWSSSCLFQSIGAVSNVSVKNYNADLIIIVHKWGRTFKLKSKKNKKQIILDDSADSLPEKNYIPYENNSNFEIISLPKIIGSFSGGIILTKNKSLYDYSKKLQKTNKNLGVLQSERKFNFIFKNKIKNNWHDGEINNTFIDVNLVENIDSCLENFQINLNTINLRKKILKENFKNVNFDNKRVGPCAILPYSNYLLKKTNFEIKHFNFSQNTKNEKYKKCLIFPIHFKIPEKFFVQKLKKLTN